MSWTSTELIESYMLNAVKVPGLTQFPDGNVKRLKAFAVEYQKNQTGESLNSCIIDAAYNFHCHTKSCFGKAKNLKRKLIEVECRYRLPQRKKRKTIVQNACDSKILWYNWNGSSSERYIKEICIKRHAYDAFQNVSCPAISQSKFSCNTNIAIIVPGPVSQYTFKYQLKDTQEDDTERYQRMAEAVRKSLLRAMSDQISDRSKVMSRFLAGSFAHQKTNIVGSTMASFLVRHMSRFIMSHDFTWCPLRDIEKLLSNGQASVSILYHKKTPFFQCHALDYLCRPLELENLDAYDFFSQYEVVRKTRKNEEQLLQFHNGYFQHPSYQAKTQHFLQGVRLRHKKHLIKIFQYDFPDTAQFGGSILDANIIPNEIMETYSKHALLLFLPCRQLSDIHLNNSCTFKLREMIHLKIIGEKAMNYLQNIQDVHSNCFRITKLEDDLQRNTKAYHSVEANSNIHCSEEDESSEIEGVQLDDLLHVLELESEIYDGNEIVEANRYLPQSFCSNTIRQKGVLNCGYDSLARMNVTSYNNRPCFELQSMTQQNISTDEEDAINSNDYIFYKAPRQQEIISILLSKRSRRTRTFEEITNNPALVIVLEANGSVESIVDWAINANLDNRQKRAFEIITGSFLLTFYSDMPENEMLLGRGYRTIFQPFINEKKKLEALTEKNKRRSKQLICLLHGPGGCGKTTIIDLVIEYGREYCSYMKNYQFTSRTIVVTAMTGVAATLLLGETTHSAVYLNQQKDIQPEQVEAWESTRLLIIDEISFASKHEFKKLHENLRHLRQSLNLPYGGLNIVFAGDMRQLEPVGNDKKPIYNQDCPEFSDWINCFIELNGKHRFKGDLEWGNLLTKFRDGNLTKSDINKINMHIVTPTTILPENIKYATYYNRDRDAINTGLFEERCRILMKEKGSVNDSIIVFSDMLQVQNASGTYITFKNCKNFWENCGEDDINTKGRAGRMDPVLRLYRGCHVMLPCNKNVKAGQANGTQAIVENVVLKPGEVPQNIVLNDINITIYGVQATQVLHIVLHHCNSRVQPQVFLLQPKQYSFTAKILKPRSLQVKGNDREVLHMKCIQLPILINNATTGHKLQGSGVNNLFIHKWSYVTNWPYVMLSRVKTRMGLFCRDRLSTNLHKYAVPDALNKLLDKLRRMSPSYEEEEEL
jgi:PIF1-like helicase